MEDKQFHDLRPTTGENCRLQGRDYFRIIAATGHQNMIVVKQYNPGSREDLRALRQRKT
jgi:hypothetical protein